MNNLVKRLLLAALAIPLLILVVFFCPWLNHGCFNAILVVFSFLGGWEMAGILNKKGFFLKPGIAGLLAALVPAAAYAELFLPRTGGLFLPFLMALLMVVLIPQGFPKNEGRLENSLMRFPGYVYVLVYPGLFLSYIARLSGFPDPVPVILLFLALVFSNDSFAYIVGMLFGKKNRGLFFVSPNKSLAGLIGGLAGSLAAGFVVSWIFPELFRQKYGFLILVSLGTAGLAVAGDLIESAVKRSAGVKDSGTLLSGRGGVMDSLDSLLFSAPFYYYLMGILLRGHF